MELIRKPGYMRTHKLRIQEAPEDILETVKKVFENQKYKVFSSTVEENLTVMKDCPGGRLHGSVDKIENKVFIKMHQDVYYHGTHKIPHNMGKIPWRALNEIQEELERALGIKKLEKQS